MIQLKPLPYNYFTCPECKKTTLEVKDSVFTGIYTLADCVCTSCKHNFYHDFPIGHSLLFPQSISKDGSRYYTSSYGWFSKTFRRIFDLRNHEDINITKRVFKQHDEVIILNCLDTVYGHSLLKLLNAQYYLEHEKESGLVVIITKNLEWLIPEGVAEVWIVDEPQGNLMQWFERFDQFVKTELTRFKEVYLSVAFSHPEPAGIDFKKFTGLNRFDVSKFDKGRFTVTFVLREDRFWLRSAVEKTGWLAVRKLNLLKLLNFCFVLRQNYLVKRTIANIKRIFPNAMFHIVGFGNTGAFKGEIKDGRTTNVTTNIEKQWCEIYASSHVVVGMHGSNMLLPTALAGAFVEILPSDRLGNFMQDIMLPYSKRDLHYFGRFVNEFISPRKLAKLIVSMRTGFRFHHATMHDDFLTHKKYDDVSWFGEYIHSENPAKK